MANAVEIMIQAQDYASDVFERLQNTGVQAADRISSSMDDVGNEARSMEGEISTAMNDIEQSAREAEGSIDDYGQTASDTSDSVQGGFEEQKDAINGVALAVGAAGAAMSAYAQAQSDINTRVDQFAYLTGNSEGSMRELIQGVTDASFGTEEAITVLEQGRKQGMKSEDQLRKYAESWKMVSKATGQPVEDLMEFAPILDRANARLGDGTKAMDTFGWVTQNTTSSIPQFMDAVSGSMVDIGDAEIELDKMAAALKVIEENYGVTGPEAIAIFQTKIGEVASEIESETGEAGFSMDTFAQKIGSTTEEINNMSEGVQGSNQVMQDLAGIQDENATLFDKVMGKVSDFNQEHSSAIQLAGTLGTVMMGLTPVMLGLANAQAIYASATSIATGATTAFGTAFTILTGPIGLAILAITAIIGIGYLLIKNWDTVKQVGIATWEGIVDIAQWAWDMLKKGAELAFKGMTLHWRLMYKGVKAGIEWIMEIGPKVWDGIKNAGKAAWDFIKSYWSGVGDFFSGLWDGVIEGFKAPINFMISSINTLIDSINKINIKVPNWVPGIGGNNFGFNLSNIPRLHTGGIYNAPQGQSEGIALLKDGEKVTDPMTTRREAQNNNNNRPQIIQMILDGRVIGEVAAEAIQDEVILRGGE